jgi:hypothetical protein
VVDFLRSAYRTRVRFFSESEELTEVQWYFCKAGAAELPLLTPFRSLNWDIDYLGGLGPLGEVRGEARPWVNGSQVGNSLASNFCGTADQWHEGQPNPPSDPVPVDSTGTLLCCDRAGIVPPPFVTDCALCPAPGAAQTYTVRVTGFFGSDSTCDELNRDYEATHLGGCSWSIPDFTLSDGRVFASALVRLDAGNWFFELVQRGLADTGCSFTVPASSCLLVVTGTVTELGSNQQCFGLPGDSFVTIIPGPHP